MTRTLLAALLLSVAAFPALAQTPPVPQVPSTGPVYPGCAVPGVFKGATWYVDAVHGNDTFAGAEATPFASLAKAIKTAKSGDQILVMNGDYGDLRIGSFKAPLVNTDFVAIEAAPGQTPHVNSIIVQGGAMWIVRGFKVQSTYDAKLGWWQLVYIINNGNGANATRDIIIDGNDVSSADDSVAATWTVSQWQTLPRSGFVDRGSLVTIGLVSCISATDNHFHNVAAGAGILGPETLFARNTIDHFTVDGIDYAASDLQISGNYIHDVVTTPTSPHQDGMQGQIGDLPAGLAFNTFTNVLIDRNTIIRQTDPNLKLLGSLQGIDNYDEAWVNWQASNNVIVTSACWGISSGSATNSIIVNNTVLADGWTPPTQTFGCWPTVSMGGLTHEGGASSNDIIENNIANSFMLLGAPNVVMQNNIGQVFEYPADPFGHGGEALLAAQGGWLATNLWTTTAQWSGLFMSWNPPANASWAPFAFDLHLAPGSAATGFGVPALPPNAGAL